jgi:hypothetical protein
MSNDSIVFARYLLGRKIDSTDHNYWGNKYDDSTIPPNLFLLDEFITSNVKRHLQKGAITYYLFSLDSVRTIPWERIRDERIILKEVVFHTWEEMEACNFTITYP